MSLLHMTPSCHEDEQRTAYAAALIAHGLTANDAQAIAGRTQFPQPLGRPSKTLSSTGASPSLTASPVATSTLDGRLIEVGTAIDLDAPRADELIFHHSILCQAGLPRRRVPGREFQRRVGSVWLHLQAGVLNIGGVPVPQPIPYGATPRLALACISTLALRSSSPAIEIGRTPADFLRRIGMSDTQGHRYDTLRRQFHAMAASRLQMGFADKTFNGMAVKQFEAWLPRAISESNKWPSVLVLTEDFYKELVAHGVPLDRRALQALTGSALCIDVYTWLAYRLHRIEGAAVPVSWTALRQQFGQEYTGRHAEDDFRKSFLQALTKVQVVYPRAKVVRYAGGLELHGSPPPVPPKPGIALSSHRAGGQRVMNNAIGSTHVLVR